MQIQKILHDVPDPYKEVFMWRVFAELSYKQIGQLFGKSENWACVTYHRARNMIKERLEDSKCAACRTELENMKTPNALEVVASNTQVNDEKPLKAFKKKYNRKLFFIVAATVVITIFAPMLFVHLSSQIAYCLLPVISLVFGIVLLNKSAMEINSVFGFRTKTSTKSPQTWEYCNKLCAKVLIVVGSIAMIVIAVFNEISNLLFGFFEFGEMVNIIVIMAVLISIPIVDIRCKKKFPDLFYDNKK